MCISYGDLQLTTDDPSSLEEIRRKQNLSESLTNISDDAFDFFSYLEVLCRTELDHSNIVEYGKDLYAQVRKHLLTDSVLFQKWLTLFKVSTKAEYAETSESVDDILCGMIDICISNIEIFDEVVTMFLKVAFSQFRRDYLSYIKKEKGKALRKKVTERFNKCSKAIDMQFLREDKSVGKSIILLI
jgi:hypothetical protein